MNLAILLLGLAAAQEGDSRDDDIFGGSGTTAPPADPAPPTDPAPAEPQAATPAPEPTPAEVPADPMAVPLDQPLLSDASISGILGEAEERLTVGGSLTLRPTVSIDEGAAFEDVDLSSSNILDVFLDSRPSDRLRGYVQGRLYFDWSVTEGDLSDYGEELDPTTVLLDQAWVKFDIGRTVFVTAGQQRIRWGAGRFWNPTDALNNQALDPLAFFDVRTGVSLLKVHVPIGSTTNLYAVGNLDGANALDEVGGAFRAETVIGLTELSVSAAARKDQPLRLGADMSTGIGLFDLHAELALLHGVTDPFYEGSLDFETFELPTETSREDDWIPQLATGAEITLRLGDEDNLSLGAEYFYNDLGYDSAELYPWLLFNGQFKPFYLGRHYVAGYAYLPSPGQLDETSFTLSSLNNLSDGSSVVRFDWRQTALNWLSVSTYASYYFGDAGEFHYSLSVPATPFVEGLEDGLEIPAPTLDVGVWLSMDL